MKKTSYIELGISLELVSGEACSLDWFYFLYYSVLEQFLPVAWIGL